MTQYLSGNTAFDTVRRLQQGPTPAPNTRQTYEAEQKAAQRRVLESPYVRRMLATKGTLQAALAKQQEAVKAIKQNRDLTDEAKQRQAAAAKEETWRYISEGVVGEFLENEEALRKQHAAIPAGLSTNPADLARTQAFGAILPHLTPDAFIEMMDAAISNRDRAMLGVMVPVASSLPEYKKPFRDKAGKLFEMAETAKLAMETPESHAANYAAELADGLRNDLTFLVGTLNKQGAVEAVHYEATSRFNEVEAALGDDSP